MEDVGADVDVAGVEEVSCVPQLWHDLLIVLVEAVETLDDEI